MANFAVAIKDEIRRLARKEVKEKTATTARAVARYRREIAALKRQLRLLEKRISQLESQTRNRPEAKTEDAPLNGHTRFSARSVKAQRSKAGLSAADYARLVGVSPLTIYNWEHGKSRPRAEQLASLIAVRGLGKRDAQARLERAESNGAITHRKSRSRRPKK